MVQQCYLSILGYWRPSSISDTGECIWQLIEISKLLLLLLFKVSYLIMVVLTHSNT